MSALQLAEAPVSLTDSALMRVAQIIGSEGNPDLKFRISVSGGGCSGFQYGFSLDDCQSEDDVVIERDGITVLIDSVSVEYLRGAEIDFVEDLVGSSFQINNPNASSKCGCGSSFSV